MNLKLTRHISVLVLMLLAVSPALLAVEGREPLYQATTIASSGSYVVTRDITVSSGIVFDIQADNVYIDFDGHKVETTGAANVISASDQTGIRIANGIIVGGPKGIFLENTGGAPIVVRVDHMHFSRQSTAAIHVKGVMTGGCVVVVEHNAIDGVGGGGTPTTLDGILVEYTTDSSISHNVVRGCRDHGIRVSMGGNNRVVGNTAAGTGVAAPPSGVGIKLEAAVNCDVTGNVAAANVVHGIQVAGDNNEISDNTTSGSMDGIMIEGLGNSVRNNTSSGNLGSGIKLAATSSNTTLEGNAASKNMSEGILVEGPANSIRDNSAHANGANGIKVTSDNNTIDSNHVILNVTCGINLTSQKNIVSHNRQDGNVGPCSVTQNTQCPPGVPTANVPGIVDTGSNNVICGNVGIP